MSGGDEDVPCVGGDLEGMVEAFRKHKVGGRVPSKPENTKAIEGNGVEGNGFCGEG